MKIAILGAGAWGTALAINFSSNHQVALWGRRADELAQMADVRRNVRYLPDHDLPSCVKLEADLSRAVRGAELALLVVPMSGFRGMVRELASISAQTPLAWACKGFEAGTARMPHQIVGEEFPGCPAVGVLSGPSFAAEVAAGLPTAVTFAANDAGFARDMAASLNSTRFRVYSSDDVTGVEIGGAVKNVMAIAAGISDGMGFGNNARAGLVTRGLAEVVRLGTALGGKPETFFGLSGVGDLILTCTGDLSRNRTVGLKLGQGRALDDILRDLGHVAEGVHTAREVQRLGVQAGVDMPITQAVCEVLFEGLSPKAAVEQLLSREPKDENHP